MLSLFRRLMKNDKGVTAIEYTLIGLADAPSLPSSPCGSVGTKATTAC